MPEHDHLPIPGHPDYYAAPSGDIWSYKYGRPAKLAAAQRSGQRSVRLSGPKRGSVHHAVGTLVALAYLGPPPSRQHVAAHLGRTDDDRPSNLAWRTKAEVTLRRARMRMTPADIARAMRVIRATVDNLISEQPVEEVAARRGVPIATVRIVMNAVVRAARGRPN